MSEAKFTKGEWWIDERHSTFLGITGSEGLICEVVCSMDGCHIDPDSEELAIARLIAAAPEMYELLASLRGDYGMSSAVGKEIDTLLAKARSE